MFKSLALISVLTSVAWAQSTTNATSSSVNTTSSSTNTLIPSGISSSCTTFLNSFNSDSTLNNCLTTLTNVTSAFAPGSPTPPSSAVTTALTNFCNDTVTNTCPESLIRSKITDFYSACSAELTANSNPSVLRIYDVLYTLIPLRKSVCSKDDSGNFCAQGPSATTRELNEDNDGSSFGINDMLVKLFYMENDNGALRRRDSAIVLNTTSFVDQSILFLFFKPDLNATQLCVSCVRQVLTAYINFESNSPYGPGTNNSLLLSTQSALFTAVQSKCPANFLSGAVQAAGGLSGGGAFSSAISTYGAEYQRIIALVMGAVAMVVSVVL